MPNAAKSSDISGENALNVLKNMTNQDIPVDKLLSSMDRQEVIKFLLGQYNLLDERMTSLESSFKQLQEMSKEEGRDTAQRIERILSLMTSNMAFIKQMIQLEDVNTDKLTEQEKINANQELQFTGLIDRQNRFAMCLTSIDNNTKAILEEISKLKARATQNDQFHFRLVVIGSIAIGVVTWLMTGDNLMKIANFLHSIYPS